MNIALLRALPVGNAVELTLAVDGDITWLRLLRRPDDEFAGPDDPDATCVLDELRSPDATGFVAVLDSRDIANGVPLFYQLYGHDGTAWQASAPATITPESTLLDRSIDPLIVLRDRLTVGLAEEIAAGRLKPPTGHIPVWTAPPQVESTSWPVVTLRLEADRPAERFIGEMADDDARLPPPDGWMETEGWLSHVTLQVIGWSQNPDERIALRQALKRLVLGNLPVFAAQGLVTPDWSQQDSEDFQTFNAPVYQTVGTFTCLAPSLVAGTVPAIGRIDTLGYGIPPS